jgi:DNA-binding NarL/FixJ family response regulator
MREIMNKTSRILIVEDHALLRAGMRSLISKDPTLEVVADLSNARDAIAALRTLEPDLILMDISMPGMNGIEAVIDIKKRYPAMRIIIVTVHKADEYIHSSLQAGANGYLLKDATHEELQVAIRSVLSGKTYLSPDVSGDVIRRYLNARATNKPPSPLLSLTHRERQVLKLIAEGRTNKHIAEYFTLSVKTVEKHRSNLMQKLDLHNASALTTFAIEHGLLGHARHELAESGIPLLSDGAT